LNLVAYEIENAIETFSICNDNNNL